MTVSIAKIASNLMEITRKFRPLEPSMELYWKGVDAGIKLLRDMYLEDSINAERIAAMQAKKEEKKE